MPFFDGTLFGDRDFLGSLHFSHNQNQICYVASLAGRPISYSSDQDRISKRSGGGWRMGSLQ